MVSSLPISNMKDLLDPSAAPCLVLLSVKCFCNDRLSCPGRECTTDGKCFASLKKSEKGEALQQVLINEVPVPFNCQRHCEATAVLFGSLASQK